MTYAAPINDMRFALEAAADLWSLRARFPDLDEGLLAAILEGAAALSSETLAPLNRVGDQNGATLANGDVRTPPGFREAYDAFAAGGWQGLYAPAEYGGQGLPRSVAMPVLEMMQSANLGFSLLPLLTLGAIEAIEQHGAQDQKDLYLAKLISGEWSGTMNLTEPQAGSDLGMMTTKAVQQDDGSYAISGQKIFITYGEHDCTPNIVHLVLARIEGAPAGSRGISLFIVPKFLDADGARNALRCIGIEEKMGVHASPTCTMAYEGATGWLIGEANRGLVAMFTMMNAARLLVGVQGVALAEAAYQKALAYARERKQGGGFIIEHPDVRRMLLTMKAKTQAARMICYACAVAADAGDKPREDLLTPLAKAWSTDIGVEAASLGVQVHGGMGFIEETGAAQYYRDVRITTIYEGTNGIQAIDLYGRKLKGDGGAEMKKLIAEAHEAAAQLGTDSAKRLAAAASVLEDATAALLGSERDDALAGATPYLALAGDVTGGMLWAQALKRAPSEEQAALFAFYAETVLARARSYLPDIKIGAAALIEPN